MENELFWCVLLIPRMRAADGDDKEIDEELGELPVRSRSLDRLNF